MPCSNQRQIFDTLQFLLAVVSDEDYQIGRSEFMGKRKNNSLQNAQQPIKCKGCIWGEWRETKQFCKRVKCVKEAKSALAVAP